MNNLYEVRKEVEYLKNRLQVMVSDKSYDSVIEISNAKEADAKLMEALSILEDTLVEFRKVKARL